MLILWDGLVSKGDDSKNAELTVMELRIQTQLSDLGYSRAVQKARRIVVPDCVSLGGHNEWTHLNNRERDFRNKIS